MFCEAGRCSCRVMIAVILDSQVRNETPSCQECLLRRGHEAQTRLEIRGSDVDVALARSSLQKASMRTMRSRTGLGSQCQKHRTSSKRASRSGQRSQTRCGGGREKREQSTKSVPIDGKKLLGWGLGEALDSWTRRKQSHIARIFWTSSQQDAPLRVGLQEGPGLLAP